MPNWCNNNVEISGPKKVIDQIQKIVDEKHIKDDNDPNIPEDQGLLDWMVPMPKELRETQADGTERKDLLEKYGHSDWYGWANDNWGTKWDIHEFYGFTRKNESTIEFGFDTAWAPALTAFDTWLANNDIVQSSVCTMNQVAISQAYGTTVMISVLKYPSQHLTVRRIDSGTLNWARHWTAILV